MSKVDDAVIQAHSELAKAYFDAENARQAHLAAVTDELVPAGVTAAIKAQATEYTPAQTAFAGVFFMTISTSFTDPSNGKQYTFSGLGGGLGGGDALTWGAAWLNFAPAQLDGQSFRFQANVAVAAVNVQWWGMDGSFWGSFVGAGIPAGLGIFGGQGSVHS